MGGMEWTALHSCAAAPQGTVALVVDLAADSKPVSNTVPFSTQVLQSGPQSSGGLEPEPSFHLGPADPAPQGQQTVGTAGPWS